MAQWPGESTVALASSEARRADFSCSAGCFDVDGGLGVQALVEVGLQECLAFAGECGSLVGWEEFQGVRVDDLVGPAAFVDQVMVEKAEGVEVLLGRRT